MCDVHLQPPETEGLLGPGPSQQTQLSLDQRDGHLHLNDQRYWWHRVFALPSSGRLRSSIELLIGWPAHAAVWPQVITRRGAGLSEVFSRFSSMCVRNSVWAVESKEEAASHMLVWSSSSGTNQRSLSSNSAAEPQHGWQEMRDILLVGGEKTEKPEFITEWWSRK